MDRQLGMGRKRRRLTALAGCAALVGGVVAAVAAPASAAARAPAARPPAATSTAARTATAAGCHLGNGVKHVIEFTFDNVHFFRDNPNVPPTWR